MRPSRSPKVHGGAGAMAAVAADRRGERLRSRWVSWGPRVVGWWLVEQLAAEAGEDDGQSFVEFGGAVVGGEVGGE